MSPVLVFYWFCYDYDDGKDEQAMISPYCRECSSTLYWDWAEYYWYCMRCELKSGVE